MKRIGLILILVLLMASTTWASVVEFMYPSGSNLYAIVRTTTATVWQTTTSTFVAWADLDVANYDVALTDGSGDYYYATFPAGIAAGTYTVAIYLRAGGAPATTDTLLGSGQMPSDGVPKVDASSRLLTGTVATAGNTRTFTLSTGFPAAANRYPAGTVLTFTDATTGLIYASRLQSYSASRVVTVNPAFAVAPELGDAVSLWPFFWPFMDF